ncbi:hypothetical protein PSV08DRAFT_353037 [Bipolaris maydis]|uniref:uncharacterized protein n=1 Tax=Cochliobolus heterostrophus TaxID=5016 RepID=UPI0024DD868D|nr:hypothetical protein J3E74DRAFT_286922 [Bipolaris maydis]KAJ6269876.1 hypothetical protein PSV08DRAFT_353037 [Bipolaris maydis]
MVSTNKFNASVAKPKPAVKQVKVVNRGSEIKQMTATADAVRKAATSSKQPSSLDPIPHKDPDSTHNAHTSGRILIGKNAASRIRQRNDAVGKTAGPISQPKTKKIATEKKDGLYNASSKPKSALPRSATVATPISQPKAKKDTNDKKDRVYNAPSKPKSTSPRPDIVATEAATAKRPAPCQNSSRQRMANNAIRSLKERRWIAKTALDGLFPLLKTDDAIEIAVAALEKQIDDCDSDIQQLKRLVHSSHAGDVKLMDFKAILALASLVSCKRNTDEDNKPNDTITKTPRPDTKGKQLERGTNQTRPRDETLNTIEGNPITTNEARTKRMSPQLDDELFGPDSDLAAPISPCTNPITPCQMNTDAHPGLPKSKAVCVPRTHKPFNAPTAYPTENGIAAEPIKNDKLHTGNADNREQTQTQSSESKSPYPKDNGGGVKPVSRASSEDRFLDKKKGVEDKRGEKRKYGYIEAEDTPNKKVHLSGQ